MFFEVSGAKLSLLIFTAQESSTYLIYEACVRLSTLHWWDHWLIVFVEVAWLGLVDDFIG